MKTAEAARLAIDLMKQWGLSDWKFGFNYRKTVLGLCRYGPKRIELSWHLVVLNEEAEIRETILHEIAHALAGWRAGHGPAWKAAALKVGAKPVRCSDGTAAMPVGAWRAACQHCGKLHSMHRKPKRKYICRCFAARRQRTALVWDKLLSLPAPQPDPVERFDLFD